MRFDRFFKLLKLPCKFSAEEFLDQDLKRAEIEQKMEIVESIAAARNLGIRGQRGARMTVTVSHIEVIGEEKGTHQADLLLLSVVELAKIRCCQKKTILY